MKRWLLYIAVLLTISAQAVVYTPASLPNPKDAGQSNYVSNPDRILSDEDVDFLDRCAARLERETGAEMCVAALGDIGGMSAFDFAYELFQRWGIGKKGKNTGVLILFAEASHDVRIMTGVGLEGVLPDAKCSRIIQQDMIPAFRKGDYGGGLCLGALRIYEVCTDGEAPEELRNMKSVTNRGGYEEEEDEWTTEGVLIVVAYFAVLCFLIWFFWKHGNGRNGGKSSGGGGPIIFTGGGRSYGGGGFSGGSWGGGSTFGGGAGGKW